MLTSDVWKQHGEEVVGFRPYIPGSFDQPPHNIALKIYSGYKAKEWQGYLYGLSPALLHNILPQEYWQKICKLVHAIRIVHQSPIPQAQLQLTQTILDNVKNRFSDLNKV